MKNVFFAPWVGKFYSEKGYNNKKIMVLGESHHGSEKDKHRNMTTQVLTKYLNHINGTEKHVGWMNTFTKFTTVFFGEKRDSEFINNFWNSVLFYNFVQELAGEGSGQAPTKQMFKNGEVAFQEVLNKYDPDVLIVWGKRLWNHLPENGYSGEEDILDKDGGKFWYYKSKTKNIPAYSIYHPASSYLGFKHSKYLKRVMELV